MSWISGISTLELHELFCQGPLIPSPNLHANSCRAIEGGTGGTSQIRGEKVRAQGVKNSFPADSPPSPPHPPLYNPSLPRRREQREEEEGKEAIRRGRVFLSIFITFFSFSPLSSLLAECPLWVFSLSLPPRSLSHLA